MVFFCESERGKFSLIFIPLLREREKNAEKREERKACLNREEKCSTVVDVLKAAIDCSD
jgi:hypothetical protein